LKLLKKSAPEVHSAPDVMTSSEASSSTSSEAVGTKGVSQNHLLSFDNNKVLKIINWIC